MKLKLNTNIEEYKKELKDLECILKALEEQIEVLNNFNIEVTEVTRVEKEFIDNLPSTTEVIIKEMERNRVCRSFKDFKDDKE